MHDYGMFFEYATPTDILFGRQALVKALPRIINCGKHAFFVHGKDASRCKQLVDALHKNGVAVTPFSVSGEPDVDLVEKARNKAKDSRCDYVIAMGGGSVVDTAKAVAALITNNEPILNYLEVVGQGNPLTHAPVPCIVIPTTAGTGSEVTRNAVIKVPDRRVKVSLRSPLMYPDFAVVEPSLMMTLPLESTLFSGWDAIVQLIESYLTRNTNPICDALCIQGLQYAIPAINKLEQDLNDYEARSHMSLAALYSGITLTNAGLGAVHGLAGPLGGYYRQRVPHGAICARLLPEVLQSHLLHSSEDPHLAQRLQVVIGLISNSENMDQQEVLVDLKNRICSKIPDLGMWGVVERDLHIIAEQSKSSSSMRGNPVDLKIDELVALLKQAL
jgi:alcohol dehydrogenase class IV